MLSTFESVDGEEVLDVLNEWKQICVEGRIKIIEEGMIEKLNMILFLALGKHEDDDGNPLLDYKQFISDKFPNWHLTELEETEFEEVEFECKFATIPIRLTKENGEPFDFSHALSRASNKFNFFASQSMKSLNNEYKREQWLLSFMHKYDADDDLLL